MKIKNIIKNYFYCILFVLAIGLLTYQCASVGTISGGPKDLDPPKMVSSSPKMYATNFKNKEIRIDFNKYIQLKDVNQQLNVSPPLKKKPLVWIKNKSLIIQYKDTLKENTTYTFNFGNSISDLNEGNIYNNFEFVISTGNYVDSLGVRGQIVDAFDLKPEKESVLAMLYSNLSDSAPYKEVPEFTSRTDKDGYFYINNVKPGTYRLYALKDKNFNYKYDPFTEAIAFKDSNVILDSSKISNLKEKNLFFPSDTLHFYSIKDTIRKKHILDSIATKRSRNSIYSELLLFYEKDKRQYLKDFSRKYKRRFDIRFSKPLRNDSIIIKPLYFGVTNWYLLEKYKNHDSLTIWLTDTNLIKVDTLKTVVQYWGNSKKGDLIWKSDTLNFKFTGLEKTEKKSKKQKPQTAKVTTNATGTVDLNSEPYIESEFPLSKINTNKFQLFQKVDTIEFPSKFSIVADSISPKRVNIMSSWIEQTNYKLMIFPGALENIYGIQYDTIISSFTTQKLEYYGKLTINLSGIKMPMIVQLLDKDNVVVEKYATSDGAIIFDYLQPKSYTIKVIFDENGDRIWNTGNLIKKKQPEKVLFYKDEVKIRSNWDVTIAWELK